MMFKTYKDYRKAWDKAPLRTPPIPLNIDIELSTICNLKCSFCFLNNPEYLQSGKFISLVMANKIINEASAMEVPALKFNWRGEPTTHPHFSTILQYSKSKGFLDILVNTNGNYNESCLDGLMACSKVMFSVDSMVEETYSKIRKGGNLPTVLFNIQRLIDSGHNNIWVRRVITEDNKHEDFIGKVKQVFGNSVKVSEHFCFDRVNKQDTKNMKRTYCGYPSQRIVIDVDGNAYPCCIDYFGTMKIGNIETHSISDLWRRQEAIRKNLKESNIWLNTCVNCTSWKSYKSPKREMVEDIAK